MELQERQVLRVQVEQVVLQEHQVHQELQERQVLRVQVE
jgi:hypothetical protein